LPVITAMELGLVFWAERNIGSNLEQLAAFGLSAGQLGVPPEIVCEVVVEEWASALRDAKVTMTSAVCSYAGEDYSNLATVHETVGFTTESFRAPRIARTKAVSDLARALDILAVSCHIGFIPSDPSEALYDELRDLTRVLCDYCAGNGQNFVLETGQESAEVLLQFIHDVERPNLKVNFDPANMIMYDSGDPLAALTLLSSHVISVHCKDANPPVAGSSLLGSECVLGDGKVNFPAFLQKLKEIKYQGILCIEREEPDLKTKLADIHTAVARLKEWKAEAGL
jgi:L-ribulose-5-phosphate 3-epimerase